LSMRGSILGRAIPDLGPESKIPQMKPLKSGFSNGNGGQRE